MEHLITLRLQQNQEDMSLGEMKLLTIMKDSDSLLMDVAHLLSIDISSFILYHVKDGFKKRIIDGWDLDHYLIEPYDILHIQSRNGNVLNFQTSITESASSLDDNSECYQQTVVIQQQHILDEYNSLVLRIQSRNHQDIHRMITHDIINTTNSDGWTPLHWMCYHSNLELIKMVNLKGITYDINQTTNDLWSPLIIAIRQDSIQIVKYLLNYNGLNINLVTSQGSALHMACRMGNRQIIELLMSCGADPLILDQQRCNVYQVSSLQTQLKLIAILNDLDSVSEIDLYSQIKPMVVKGTYYTPGSSIWTVKTRYLVVNPLLNCISRYLDSECNELRLSIKISAIQGVTANYNSLKLKRGYYFIRIQYDNNLELFLGFKKLELQNTWITLIRQAMAYVKNVADGMQFKNIYELSEEIDLDSQTINKHQSIEKPLIIEVPKLQPKSVTVQPKFINFEILNLLGQGAFGCVFKAKCKLDNKIYAMKVMNKQRAIRKKQLKYAVTEVNVLTIAQHPYVINLQYAFQTPANLYLAMEYCGGGDLFQLLAKFGQMREDFARFYLAEILLGLEYLHSLDVLYRDLKPENILISSSGHVKLADFGLCKEQVAYEISTKSFCGSPAYLPPEMLLQQKVGKYGDYYAYGILAYELMVGVPPLVGNTLQEVYKAIKLGNIKYPPYLSDVAKDFISQLTCNDPYKRLNFHTARNHPFFKQVVWGKLERMEIHPPIPVRQQDMPELFQNLQFKDQDYEEGVDVIDRVVGYQFNRI